MRRFLLRHPLLVIELGFDLHLDASAPYGFDVEKTLPSRYWLGEKLRQLDEDMLQDLLASTVASLQEEIPALGETIAFDVTHIYAWVRENNPRVYVAGPFNVSYIPKGDPDCRLGVKKSSNQESPVESHNETKAPQEAKDPNEMKGKKEKKKESLFGYGSGVAACTDPVYGDVVLAEHTLPFNEADVTYFLPLFQCALLALDHYPRHITADAAYDTWYVYEKVAHGPGIAAVALNTHGHDLIALEEDGTPLCPIGLRMHASYRFLHTRGYQAQRFRCPLLFPEKTGQCCEHEQFHKGKGCVKDINQEKGWLMRARLDRQGPLYHAVYNQRTSAERVNSKAKEIGLERPKVRNIHSVRNLNTLTYLVLNVRVLARAKSINAELLSTLPGGQLMS